jgi:tetratricopeptide (TPR) repeat protein
VLYIEDALEYHKRALAIFEDLDDKVWMAQDYGDIAIVLKHMGSLEEARESVSKGLTILEQFEKKTGYHHPQITQLHEIQNGLL